MKASIRSCVIAVAALLSTTSLANPVPGTTTLNPKVVPTDGASAPHNANGAAVINPGANTTKHTHESFFVEAVAQKCFTFTSDNPNWYYTNAGPWSGSGSFGYGQKQICVSRSDSAGGAMFISPTPDTPPGSTKLECYFPTSGTANCDISLVDGYSLSVACQTANTPTIGGYTNLWSTGAWCDDQSMVGQGICKNDKGYADTTGEVAWFFQNGINNGNNYCIWKNCWQDYFFNVEQEISCHVSGGR